MEPADESEFGAESSDDEKPMPTVTVKWRINKGEVLQFATPIFDGAGYVVAGPMAVEMARMLSYARQFVTSNGGEGPSERILQFEDLDVGEQIRRILDAGGH